MARIIAIDYGLKRTGLAVTDPLQIIATGLHTVPTKDLTDYLKAYIKSKEVSTFVMGMPKHLNNQDTDITAKVRQYHLQLQKNFPDKKIELIDERYTSKIALDAMLRGGMKKKNRRNKGNVDKISAVIILQSFLEKQP